MKSPSVSRRVMAVLIFSLCSEASGFSPFFLTQLACWLNSSLSFFSSFKIATVDTAYLKIYCSWESHSPLISLCKSLFAWKMSVYKCSLQISCSKGNVTRDDSQRRLLAQHSVTALLRHCFDLRIQPFLLAPRRQGRFAMLICNLFPWAPLTRGWCLYYVKDRKF